MDFHHLSFTNDTVERPCSTDRALRTTKPQNCQSQSALSCAAGNDESRISLQECDADVARWCLGVVQTDCQACVFRHVRN